MGVSENVVYPYTQWFCWSLSLLNGYFIGKIHIQLPSTFHIENTRQKPRFFRGWNHSSWDHGFSLGVQKKRGRDWNNGWIWVEDRKTIVSKSQCLANTQKMNGLKCSWSLKNHPLVKLSTSLSRENGANSNSSLSFNQSTNQSILPYSLQSCVLQVRKATNPAISIQLFHLLRRPDPRYVQPGTRNVFPIEVALFRLTRFTIKEQSS